MLKEIAAELTARVLMPYAYITRYVDRRISGLNVKINCLEKGWMQGFVVHSMIFSDWELIGLIGINFWTIGHLNKDGHSTRFDENSPYYQAWFGCYAAESEKEFGLIDGKLNIFDYNEMGISDQNGWLRFYLHPTDSTKLDRNSVRFIKKIKLKSGHTCYLYQGEYDSFAENSDKANSFRVDVFARIIYKLYDGEKKNFTHKAFIPYFEDKKPFKPVKLKGYFGVVPFYEEKRHVVFYGCATKKNFPKIKKDIELMIACSEIELNKREIDFV